MDPLGVVPRLSAAAPGTYTVCARCIDRGDTGGERTMDEMTGKEVSSASRTIFRPDKPGICDEPSRLGDLSLGDETSVDSKRK